MAKAQADGQSALVVRHKMIREMIVLIIFVDISVTIVVAWWPTKNPLRAGLCLLDSAAAVFGAKARKLK
jgi:hypothetical protein